MAASMDGEKRFSVHRSVRHLGSGCFSTRSNRTRTRARDEKRSVENDRERDENSLRI